MNDIHEAFMAGMEDGIESSAACKTPGKKIRSKGKGRGLSFGKGEGPRGVPFRGSGDRMKVKK